MLRKELDRLPGAELGVEAKRSSRIDIDVNGKHVETTVEITRKGDKYSLSVTIDPSVQGVSKLGPFEGDRDTHVISYVHKANELSGFQVDFGKKQPRDGKYKSTELDAPSRVVRGATLSEAERHDAHFVAQRMAQSDNFEQQARGMVARGEFDPVIAGAATTSDAHARVRAMGLVGEPDSLQRLTRLLNSSDPDFTPEMRSAVPRATLEATRADLVRSGGLAPGDELLMLFRGVTGARTGDYEREASIYPPRAGRRRGCRAGLYGSQDFERAAHRRAMDKARCCR